MLRGDLHSLLHLQSIVEIKKGLSRLDPAARSLIHRVAEHQKARNNQSEESQREIFDVIIVQNAVTESLTHG